MLLHLDMQFMKVSAEKNSVSYYIAGRYSGTISGREYPCCGSLEDT